MRIKPLFVVLAFLAFLASLPTGILAKQQSIRASPYQAVFFWYAYRLEIEAFGLEKSQIGRGCSSRMTSGGCNFDSFLRWIDKGGRATWRGSTDIGDNFDPDVSHAVKQLAQSNYQSVLDTRKLLDSLPVVCKFTVVLDQLLERIQAARLQMKTTGKEESIPLERLRESIGGLIEARRQDQGPGPRAFVLDWARKQTFNAKMKEKVVKGVESHDQIIDMDGTIQSNDPRIRAVIHEKFKALVKDMREHRFEAHGTLIERPQQVQSTLLDPLPCSG